MEPQRKQKGRKPKAYSQADRLARMMRTLASRAEVKQRCQEPFEITWLLYSRSIAAWEAEYWSNPVNRIVPTLHDSTTPSLRFFI